MKKNLGKAIILFILFTLHVELFASSYEWEVKANKTKAYVNEAIYLTYTCRFDDKGELYTIDFNPIGNYENYDIKLLKENTQIINAKRVSSYEFVAFVKKAGNISFDFDAIMKKTNEDSIKNTVLGRDNAFYEEFSKTKVKHTTLHVDVKETQTEIVGDFSIDVKKDDFKVKAYEPYHIEILIKGKGNFENIKSVSFELDGVKIFASEIIKKIKITKDGYSGTWKQKFAFVSEKDFKIPSIDIEYFSLKNKTKQALHVESVNVEVVKGYAKKDLLDKVDEEFKIDYDYIYYLLFFIAGFLVSKIKFKNTNKINTQQYKFQQQLSKCKNIDEIMFLLLVKDSYKYKEIIKAIESKQYNSVKDVISDLNYKFNFN